MAYDSNSLASRKELAEAIRATLETAGFVRISGDTVRANEEVYQRSVKGGAFVRVFTTINDGGWCRPNGADAIRVCGVWVSSHGGQQKSRGLTSETRVNRTGEINAITGRMLERMRAVWKEVNTRPVCRSCSAMTFQSKAGKPTCCRLCWLAASAPRDAKPSHSFSDLYHDRYGDDDGESMAS